MATIPTSEIPTTQRDELLCTYAALLLHDEQLEISAENINKVVTAAGVKVEAYWPMLFSKALGSRDLGEMLASAGTPSAGVAAPAAGAAAGAGEAAVAEAAPAEVEEEEEDDMGFDLFD